MTDDGSGAEIRQRWSERLTVLEALVIGQERRAELLEIVSSSPDAEVARRRVADAFGLTLLQASAIQDMQVRRFAVGERERLLRERDEVRRRLL